MMKDPIPMMTRIMMIPMTILMMIPTAITTKMILMITVVMKKNRYCLQELHQNPGIPEIQGA